MGGEGASEGISQETGESEKRNVSVAKGREKLKKEVLGDSFFKERQIFPGQII